MNQDRTPKARQGFPNGYDFKGSSEHVTEEQRRMAKQKKAFEDLHNSVPKDAIKGEPAQFDEQEEFAAMMGGRPASDEPKSAEEFFGSKPQQPLGTMGQQPQQPQPSRQQRRVDERQQHKAVQQAQKQLDETKKAVYANPSLPLHKQPQHPVVQKLLKTFGLKKTPKYDLDIFVEGSNDKVTYTMTVVPEEVSSWALKEAQNRGVLDGEQTAFVYFEMLFTCCAVVAIDGEPVWRVFNIEPVGKEIEELTNDPLDISNRIRKSSGYQLAQLLWSETSPMGDKLLDFYQNKVTEKKIISSFEREADNTFRFVCPIDGCPHYEILPVELDDEGYEKSYYCKFHSSQLVKAADLKKDTDLPLA